jgi:hypothetical protein
MMNVAAVVTVGVDYFVSLQASAFGQACARLSLDSSTALAHPWQWEHQLCPPFGRCHAGDWLHVLIKNNTVNQVYNGKAGYRRTLNELYVMMTTLLSGNFAHLAAHVPESVDFRRGDVRHSQADISRVARLLGYVPTHRIDDGTQEAMDAYVHVLPH